MDKLLDKASPSAKPGRTPHDRRVVARNTAATNAKIQRPQLPKPAAAAAAADTANDDDSDEDDTATDNLAVVIPLPIYNTQERADEWW